MADETIVKKIRKVLVIFAHPDDAEFAAAEAFKVLRPYCEICR